MPENLRSNSDDINEDGRIFCKDSSTGLKFLIDTGAPWSSIQLTSINEDLDPLPVSRMCFFNKSIIAEYGYKRLKVNIELQQEFSWKFIINKFHENVIGTDFLSHLDLIVDVGRRRLLQAELIINQLG